MWAVRLLFAEAAALTVLTAYLVYLDVTDLGDASVALSLTAMAAIGAVAVFFVGRALARRSARARGPAIVVQLFLIATGGFFVNIGPSPLGAVLMAFGAITALLCLLPPTTRALGLH